MAALEIGPAGCSPEAHRLRDGGPGADLGNTRLIVRDTPAPHAADTTLWPGRAPAPVDLLARGVRLPATYPPPTAVQQRTFDRGRTADPRRQTSTP